MLYRRKILLALLETFGDSLAVAECCNLLLLFCQRYKERTFTTSFLISLARTAFCWSRIKLDSLL